MDALLAASRYKKVDPHFNISTRDWLARRMRPSPRAAETLTLARARQLYRLSVT